MYFTNACTKYFSLGCFSRASDFESDNDCSLRYSVAFMGLPGAVNLCFILMWSHAVCQIGYLNPAIEDSEASLESCYNQTLVYQHTLTTQQYTWCTHLHTTVYTRAQKAHTQHTTSTETYTTDNTYTLHNNGTHQHTAVYESA